MVIIFYLLLIAENAVHAAAAANQAANKIGFIDYSNNLLATPFATTFKDKEKEECPPCFNCMLPGFECLQFANCTSYDGKCKCPPGFGGDDCKQPCKCCRGAFCLFLHVLYILITRVYVSVCGGLDEGRNRYPRENGTVCDCPDGWEGINCNGTHNLSLVPA